MNEVLEKIQKIGIVPVVVLMMRTTQHLWQRHSVTADFHVQK